jgi:5'-phosphate synthase pdxT subunit
LGTRPFPAIFIRAPWIERTGPHVELLAQRGGHGVMVRQGNVLGTSFHPELTGDPRVHAYFLHMLERSPERSGELVPGNRNSAA